MKAERMGSTKSKDRKKMFRRSAINYSDDRSNVLFSRKLPEEWV